MIELIKDTINYLSGPTVLFSLGTLFFLASMIWPRVFWTKRSAAIFFGCLTTFFALSLLDPNFRLIVLKGDNVPIAAMIFIIPFFVWVAMYQAVENDKRIEAGEPPKEKLESDKVFTWPGLIYSEFLSTLVLSVVFFAWSLWIKAPLEQPANPANTPNPSKAPWYFLGLQEMLVYFDPWLAGVVFPSLIIVGLMAIPFLDPNKKGNGYFSFKERKWEISVFLYGFVVLWVMMVVSGTFLRGPNWNFFGPYEQWNIHKLAALTNVDLSDFFWIYWLGMSKPAYWMVREIPGFVVLGLYFVVLPFILANTLFRRFFVRMGLLRYWFGCLLFLMMVLLPIKMYMRWMFNLKYILAIPEYFFNI